MANGAGERSAGHGEAGAVGVMEKLGAQLGRMGNAGPKVTQLLSMIQLGRASQGEAPHPLGTLAEDREPLPFRRLRRVIEQDLDARLQDVFAAFEEEPFAIASLGQVHRAHTRDGEPVAVKVQHPDIGDAITGELRDVGLLTPIVNRLAPRLDAGAMLGEVRERIADELDYEIEAQHQRRLARLFLGHPHVRVPRVHTDLSTRRVLVTEYVEGKGFDEMASLSEPARDRIGEIVFRFFFGLLWRERTVAGDPHPDNCLLCPDGRVCLLDFALLRRLDAEYLEGERTAARAIVDADPDGVHVALARLGYLATSESYDPAALLEYLAGAGEWFLAGGVRRIDPGYVARTFELAYPPRSPWFSVLRRMTFPAPTLLLRRMEAQTLSLLGELRAGGDWAAIAAEHWANQPPSTPLGREEAAFFDVRGG
jgi:predicted unusual protein kinase regulating ubiquinone biosynthesis (AarF/ABC1/UbiB family)